jgi:hypothetical protein
MVQNQGGGLGQPSPGQTIQFWEELPKAVSEAVQGEEGSESKCMTNIERIGGVWPQAHDLRGDGSQ